MLTNRVVGELDAQGRKLEIIELPLAWDVSHINFYLANGGVIVPITGDRQQDDAPMAIIRNTFPERQVVGVRGKILARGGGGVHCITQQVPIPQK
ncbi:MAG: agmatine deiminase family protein [Cyanobacteria bacterium J06635_13]